MKKFMRFAICAGLMLGSIGLIHADVVTVKSARNFNRILRKHAIVIALFYKEDKKLMRNDRNLKMNLEALERMMRRVAQYGRYEDTQISFVRINTARDDLESLARDYGVNTLPAIILLKDGRLIKDGIIHGFITDTELQSFIDEHVGNTINMFVQAKSEHKRRRRKRTTSTYIGYGVGAGYGYPYYGGGVGFGVAF